MFMDYFDFVAQIFNTVLDWIAGLQLVVNRAVMGSLEKGLALRFLDGALA